MGFNLGKTFKNLVFGREGPKNPYSPVDFASLFAQDLEKPGAAYDYGGAYKDLLSMINAPSSVEAVQQDVEGQQMQDLLGDVDLETKGAYGSTMADMADRGLVGEGQSSDIAMNALAQIQGMGARTKSGIHSQYALGRLGRLSDKERRAETAQSGYAGILASMAESARQRNLQRMLGLTDQQVGAYGRGAQLQNQYTPGMLENFGQNFASSFGQQVGKNAAGPSAEDFMKMFAMGG